MEEKVSVDYIFRSSIFRKIMKEEIDTLKFPQYILIHDS